jgi:hypothetical protein
MVKAQVPVVAAIVTRMVAPDAPRLATNPITAAKHWPFCGLTYVGTQVRSSITTTIAIQVAMPYFPRGENDCLRNPLKADSMPRTTWRYGTIKMAGKTNCDAARHCGMHRFCSPVDWTPMNTNDCIRAPSTRTRGTTLAELIADFQQWNMPLLTPSRLAMRRQSYPIVAKTKKAARIFSVASAIEPFRAERLALSMSFASAFSGTVEPLLLWQS